MIAIYTVPAYSTINEAKDFWRDNLKDKKFYNRSIKKYVVVTLEGIEECIYGGKRKKIAKIRILLIYAIEQLIKDGIKVREEPDKKNRKNVKQFYTLKSTAIINGEIYNIFITLKETDQQVLYYYHAAINIEKK